MSNEVSKSEEGICSEWVAFFEDQNQRRRGLALALRILRDPYEAEDAVQDACVRLFGRPDKEDKPNYFLKTVKNVCLSRRAKRSRSMLINALSLTGPSTEGSEEASMQIRLNPETNKERTERNKRLYGIVGACSEKLTDRERALFLSHLRGHKSAEIAKAWHEDVKQIRKEMNAVKAKMRHRCQRENEKQGGQ